MIKARYYINGLSAISPQNTFRTRKLPADWNFSEEKLLRCIEPKYTEYLNPVLARRMGRIIKMGVASAIECLKDANIEKPDAIVTGTGLGCLGDTEKFLKAMIQDDEQYLTPVSFIQSIQNTVSAQIALQIQCTGHNFTFVHKGFSFESALLDAMMLLENGDANNVLVGGLDEMTDHNFHIYERLGVWKTETTISTELIHSGSKGTKGGEGSAFFVLSQTQNAQTAAELVSTGQCINPADAGSLRYETLMFLEKSNVSLNDISLVMYGYNGDFEEDKIYHDFRRFEFENIPAAWFKHLCGEYQTSGAFAFWLSCLMFKEGVPEQVMVPSSQPAKEIENILIVNHYKNNFTFYLVHK
jgi:3-oxoacyl-[acyl-carrier-protein] synthase II